MPANILKYERQYNLGKHDEVISLEDLKLKQLQLLADLEPILARGVADHLIEFKLDSEPPVLCWRSEILEQMHIGDLQMLRVLLENKKEEQQKTY